MNTPTPPLARDLPAHWLSLTCDGQIEAETLQACLAGRCDASHHSDWDAYQMVGRAMRQELQDLSAHDPVFLQKLHARMAVDATDFVAINAHQTGDTAVFNVKPLTVSHAPVQPQPANDANWRVWASALAMAGLLTGLWVLGGLGRGVEPVLALAPAAAQPQSASPVLLRDPQLDALLAAHQRQAGTPLMPQPDGLLRAAVLEGRP